MQKAPDHALTIWLDGNDIKVLYQDGGQSHTVTIQAHTLGFPNENEAVAVVNKISRENRGPTDTPMLCVRGWMALTRLLRDRRAALGRARIGEAASITQHQLEKMVKKFGGKVKVVGKKRDLKGMTLEDLGL